jgi:hypothetical protein
MSDTKRTTRLHRNKTEDISNMLLMSINLIILALLFNSSDVFTFHIQNKLYSGQSRIALELNSTGVEPFYFMESSQLQLDFNSMDEEIWKDIPEYEGFYQVSSYGNISSLDRYVKHNHGGLRIQKGRIIKQSLNQDGYYCFCLYKDGLSKMVLTHRVVGQVFILNPNNLPLINHKDTVKTNNYYKNLEWCTTQENTKHATENNLIPFGENHGMSKLTNEKVKEIRQKYERNGLYNTYYLAKKYNVSRTLIGLVINNKIWKRVG